TRSHISVGGMLRVHARPHSLGVELRDVTSAHALLGAPSHVCDRARLQTLGANVLVVELLQRSDEQVVLRGEVVEDRRLAHAGTVGHLGNRYLSMALLLDKGEGCPTELSAAAIGLGIGATLGRHTNSSGEQMWGEGGGGPTPAVLRYRYEHHSRLR